MSNLNFANRQVADVDIRDYKTKTPFISVETANTTTAGLSSDNVYAMAKGSRRIAFNNPLTGTMSIELQVYPFKLFSLFSDGAIESEAVYATTATITADTAGRIDLPFDNSIWEFRDFVFVYPEDNFADESSMIAGAVDRVFTTTQSGEGGSGTVETTLTGLRFVATTESDIAVGTKYKVAYMIRKTSTAQASVSKISFNNKKLPKDYFITMRTIDKTEDGLYTPFLLTAYKATIQRNFELSFSSEGDPASVTLNFDLCEDSDGNVLDMVELEDND